MIFVGAIHESPDKPMYKAGEEKDVQATVIFNNDCDMSLYLIKDGEKCSNNYFTLNEKTK